MVDLVRNERLSRNDVSFSNTGDDIEEANKPPGISLSLNENTHTSRNQSITDDMEKANRPTKIPFDFQETAHSSINKQSIAGLIRKRQISEDEESILNVVEDDELAIQPTETSGTLTEKNKKMKIPFYEIRKDENSEHTIVRRIQDETPLPNAVRDNDQSNKPSQISDDLKENKKIIKGTSVIENARNTQSAVEGIYNTNVDENERCVKVQKKRNKMYEEGIAKTVVGLCKHMKENVFTYMLQASDTSIPLLYLFKLKKLRGPLREINDAVEEIRNLNNSSKSNVGVQPSPLDHIPDLLTLMEHLVRQFVTNVTEDMIYKHVNTKVLLQYYNLYRTERLKTLRQVQNALQVFEVNVCEFRKYMEEALESCNKDIMYIKKQRSSPLLTSPLKRSAGGSENSFHECCCCKKLRNMEWSFLSYEPSEDYEPNAQVNPKTSSYFPQLDSPLNTPLPVNDLNKSKESDLKIYRLFNAEKQDDETKHYFTDALKRTVKVEGEIDNINNGVETYESRDGTKLITLFWKFSLLNNDCNSEEIPEIYVLKGFRKDFHLQEEFNPRGLKKEQDQVVLEKRTNFCSNLKNIWNPPNLKKDCNTQNLESNLDSMIMEKHSKDLKIFMNLLKLMDNSEQNSTKDNSEQQRPKGNSESPSLKDNSESQSPRNKFKPPNPKDNPQPQSPTDDLTSQSPRSKCGLQCLRDKREQHILSRKSEPQSPKENSESKSPRNTFKPQSPKDNPQSQSPTDERTSQKSRSKCGLQCLEDNSEQQNLSQESIPQSPSQNGQPQSTNESRESYNPLEGSSHYYSDIKFESSTSSTKDIKEEQENRSNQFEEDREYSINEHEVPIEFKIQKESCKSIADEYDSKKELYKFMFKEIKKRAYCKKRLMPRVTISERLLELGELNDKLFCSACILREHYVAVESSFQKLVIFFKEYIKSERSPELLLNEFLQKPIPNLFKKSYIWHSKYNLLV